MSAAPNEYGDEDEPGPTLTLEPEWGMVDDDWFAQLEPAPPVPAEAQQKRPEALARALDGATFIFREPATVPAIWGETDRVLWASGEGLMIVGPDGVGKTTIAQQLVLARIGLREDVLGLPVEAASEPILYVAGDRPRQAARSFARMVDEADAEALEERLIVWPGPLPFNLNRDEPGTLAAFVQALGAGTLVVDSLKDVALDLSTDETGSRLNLAFQEVIARGLELVLLHHQRKETQTGGKPRHLPDVYGSRWLTAGMGSVLLVWGDSGDLVVDLVHLKQPAEEVGPLKVIHDHVRGSSTVQPGVDLLDVLSRARHGLTVKDAAAIVFSSELPSASQVEKARRRLQSLADRGDIDRRDDPDGLQRFFARDAERMGL